MRNLEPWADIPGRHPPSRYRSPGMRSAARAETFPGPHRAGRRKRCGWPLWRECGAGEAIMCDPDASIHRISQKNMSYIANGCGVACVPADEDVATRQRCPQVAARSPGSRTSGVGHLTQSADVTSRDTGASGFGATTRRGCRRACAWSHQGSRWPGYVAHRSRKPRVPGWPP